RVEKSTPGSAQRWLFDKVKKDLRSPHGAKRNAGTAYPRITSGGESAPGFCFAPSGLQTERYLNSKRLPTISKAEITRRCPAFETASASFGRAEAARRRDRDRRAHAPAASPAWHADAATVVAPPRRLASQRTLAQPPPELTPALAAMPVRTPPVLLPCQWARPARVPPRHRRRPPRDRRAPGRSAAAPPRCAPRCVPRSPGPRSRLPAR